MCVAIYLPPTGNVDTKTLEACFAQNKDSIGFMYNLPSGIKIEKFFLFPAFLKSFRKARKENPDSEFVLHFRIATSGKIDYNNCHPFSVNNDVGLVHNGMLSCTTGDVKESDTNKFVQVLSGILTPIPDKWDDAAFWTFIGQTIGSGNKLILLRKDGDVKIINEKAGTWKEGVWFSNTNWEWRTKPYVAPTYHQPYQYSGAARQPTTNRLLKETWTLCPTCSVRFSRFLDGVCTDCYKAQVKKAATTVPATTPARPSFNTGDTEVRFPDYVVPMRIEDLLRGGNSVHITLARHRGNRVWLVRGAVYQVREKADEPVFNFDIVHEELMKRRLSVTLNENLDTFPGKPYKVAV